MMRMMMKVYRWEGLPLNVNFHRNLALTATVSLLPSKQQCNERINPQDFSSTIPNQKTYSQDREFLGGLDR